MKRLSQRQRECLDCISDTIRVFGFPPTLREIGDVMGIRSTNGVNDHLVALELKGWIKRDAMKARGIRIVGGPVHVVAAAEHRTRAAEILANALYAGGDAKLEAQELIAEALAAREGAPA